MTGHRRLGRRGRATGPLTAFLLLFGAGIGLAQTPEDWRLNKDFLTMFGRDFAAVATSPLHWRGADFGRFALISGGSAALLAGDEGIRDWAQAHKSDFTRSAAPVFEKTGNGAFLLGFSAALYAAGEIWSSRDLRRTALLSLESLATASALVWAIKSVSGRARPRTGEGALTFRMFSVDPDYNSFPSGHAAAAFAVAATIAQQTRGAAADVLAYGLATLVGLSRVHDNQHWASCVFAGSALGYFVARKIGGRHRRPAPARAPGADLGFTLGRDRLAVTLTWTF